MTQHDEGLGRRQFLGRVGLGVGALALPGFLAACGSDDESTTTAAAGGTTAAAAAGGGESAEIKALLDAVKSKRLVIAGFGGTTQDIRTEVFLDGFAERTGVRVLQPSVEGTLGDDMLLGKIPAKWDLAHSSNWMALYAAKNGKKPLVELPAGVPREDLVSEDIRPYSIQTFVTAYVAGSLKGTFDKELTWADFFDTKKYPGKRIVPGPGYYEGVAEPALLADGVSPDELYPLDLERAAAKISSIWDDLVFYDSYPQIQQYLTSKTGAIASGPNGIIQGLQNKGVDSVVHWAANPITAANCFFINPGAPDMDAALAYAGWVTDPKRQAEFATKTHYGPGFKEVFDALPADVQDGLPTNPKYKPVPTSEEWLAENYDQLVAFNKKLFDDNK
jgi:putative spermidine/putrescine transport system substrate-binding protein